MERLQGPEQLRHLLDAVVALGAGHDLPVVLDRLTHTAVDLVGAAYGALGVLDPTRTRLSEFITVGIDADGAAEIGHLPDGHGILGLLILDPVPLRLPDLTVHPDSYGFPPGHPPMHSFLGVPLFVRDEVYGNLYLTDKRGGGPFTDVDEELAVGLAAAAAVAIESARLRDRVRDLALLEDRERIARDLHDTVIQRLFATGLSLQAAARLVTDPVVASRLEQVVDELDVTVTEVRSAIFEIQHGATPRPDVRRRLLEVGDELADALGFVPAFHLDGPLDAVPDDVAAHLVAVVREGLANVARHAGSPSAEVTVVVGDGELVASIDDAGTGPGPLRPGGRGLANLRSRAEGLGGLLVVEPGTDGGTHLSWRVPLTPPATMGG